MEQPVTKAQRREEKKWAYKQKGKKHNYARWNQILELWKKRAKEDDAKPKQR